VKESSGCQASEQVFSLWVIMKPVISGPRRHGKIEQMIKSIRGSAVDVILPHPDQLRPLIFRFGIKLRLGTNFRNRFVSLFQQ
jgi:hypothetical protein